ncbi:hypothetical protein [Lactobacillus corticis]|uniref:hypothetical protein n=1 Tax=Lactobacillus corticis TaxID=2201249 RepID=UPI001BB2D0C2|nr:hypothetical protein [Lactobacillus corticis]
MTYLIKAELKLKWRKLLMSITLLSSFVLILFVLDDLKSGSLAQLAEPNFCLFEIQLFTAIAVNFFPIHPTELEYVRLHQRQNWVLARALWDFTIAGSMSFIAVLIGAIFLLMHKIGSSLILFVLVWLMLWLNALIFVVVIEMIQLFLGKRSFLPLSGVCGIGFWIGSQSLFLRPTILKLTGTAYFLTKNYPALASYVLIACGSIILSWLIQLQVHEREEIL